MNTSYGIKIWRKRYPNVKMFVNEYHVTRRNQGLFPQSKREAEKRDPGNEVATALQAHWLQYM